MNKFFLYLVSLFNPVWKGLGVDVEQLRAILQVKLTMDDRRPNAYTQVRQQQKKKPINYGSWGVIIMSFIMGIFYLYAFYVANDHFLQMLIWFSLFMMMMSTTLIADFTSVLIDVKDNFVILPKPVNDKTVVVSRMMHIVIHISKIVVPMMLPALVFLLVTTGVIATLWFILLALFLSILSIFLINAVYLVALQLTTPQRFKELLNYIQMILSVSMFAIVYLAPRMLRNVNLNEVKLSDHAWLNFIPITWFAGAWQAVTDSIYTPQYLIYIALSIIVPFASLWLVIKVFAPSFNRKLAMLGGSGTEAPLPSAAAASRSMPWYKRFARLFTNGGQEQLSFELVWLITGRSREFKLKVYPSLAYVVIYFIYFFFSGKHTSIGEAWKELPATKMFVFLIYSSSFAFITAISNLVYSDKYKSAWVYFAAPIESPGPLLMGAFKASLLKFFVPFYLLLSAFSVWVWGVKIMPDLVLGFFNVVAINLCFAFLYLRRFPFSTELNLKQNAGAFLKGMLILVIPGAVGVGHYFIAGYIWLVAIFGLLSFAALYLLYAKYRETGWARLETD